MIVDVRTFRVSVPLHTPFVTALRHATTVDTVVVVVTDEDGRAGFGEAPQVWQVTGESLASAEACLDGPLRSVVVGGDADDLRPLLRRVATAVHANSGAKAAMDVALHDLVARRRGVSLPVFLGANLHAVRTDVTLSVGATTDVSQAAIARRAEGFGTVKLKVGIDAREDVRTVAAAREAVGHDVDIRLDANQGWSPRDAVAVIRALEDADLRVELVEQPVPAHDLDGLGWVRDRVRTPILADECVFGVRDLTEVIRRGSADMVNVKLAKCGGLAAARTLLELAEAHDVGTVVGSMMETQVGIGAAASLVAAYGSTAISDLDAAWWTTKSPYDGGPTYESGVVRLPQAPGLGIDQVIQ